MGSITTIHRVGTPGKPNWDRYQEAEDFYEKVIHANLAEARDLMKNHAALAWVIEKSLVSNLADLTVVVGGMGVPEGVMAFPEAEVKQWLNQYSFTAKSSYSYWRDLDVRAISGEDGFYVFDLFPALEGVRPLLTQETFDFLTCRDLKGAKLGAVVNWPDGDTSLYRVKANDKQLQRVRVLTEYEHEEAALMYAFRQQMIDEAAPFAARVASGVYILDHQSLPKLEQHLIHDSIRLILTPSGIMGSVVCTSFTDHAVYAPFYWTPDGVNTSQVWYPPASVFTIEGLCACIWRDACVVKDLWSERAPRRPVEVKQVRRSAPVSKTVVLPRRVYHHLWGRDEQERESVEKISHAAHSVTACYVTLPDGWSAHNAAERAEEQHFPAPPPGFTFRRAHQRGGEKAETTIARKVVCKGLLTATILFGKEAEKP